MPIERPSEIETVDQTLENCAERFEALQPLGDGPKNLIFITTIVLGSTAQKLQEAVHAQEEGLKETAEKRWSDLDFPAAIAQRVQAVTGQAPDNDPRLKKNATPLLKPTSTLETQQRLAQLLMTMTADLSLAPTPGLLATSVEQIEHFIQNINDETLQSVYKMQILTPLQNLLQANSFDPQDQRQKLQHVASISAALTDREISFLETLKDSRSPLAHEAILLLKSHSER